MQAPQYTDTPNHHHPTAHRDRLVLLVHLEPWSKVWETMYMKACTVSWLENARKMQVDAYVKLLSFLLW